jgi:hypothetical protein
MAPQYCIDFQKMQKFSCLRGGVFQMPITLQQSEIIASEFRDIKGK